MVPKLTPIKWNGEAKTLLPKQEFGKWEAISFGGEGDCHVKNSVLTIESGDPMTGIRLPVKDLPKTDYEITLEARRMDGIDFFCGLTFPVNEEHCCLIVGGWSGAVVGLSNIDDEDALIGVKLTGGEDELCMITRKGMSIRFKESDLRDQGRATRGVKGITLKAVSYTQQTLPTR